MTIEEEKRQNSWRRWYVDIDGLGSSVRISKASLVIFVLVGVMLVVPLFASIIELVI